MDAENLHFYTFSDFTVVEIQDSVLRIPKANNCKQVY